MTKKKEAPAETKELKTAIDTKPEAPSFGDKEKVKVRVLPGSKHLKEGVHVMEGKIAKALIAKGYVEAVK